MKDESLIERLEAAILVCEDEGASDEGEAIREAIGRIRASRDASRESIADRGRTRAIDAASGRPRWPLPLL